MISPNGSPSTQMIPPMAPSRGLYPVSAKPVLLDSLAPNRTGADVVVDALLDEGVRHLFNYPGGVVLPLFDRLWDVPAIAQMRTHHEQAAVHAAEAYARSTGTVGCVLVTSGPGATNTVTGIANAYHDGTPLVVLVGQVPTGLIGKQSFQECDIVGMTRACTKKAFAVRDVATLPAIMRQAFAVAQAGRGGPVVVEIPKDILDARCDVAPEPVALRGVRAGRGQSEPDHPAGLDGLMQAMRRARRPVWIAGGGLARAGDDLADLFTDMAARTGVPVVSTLMGLGVVPSAHPVHLGMAGLHGTYEANQALYQADLIVSFGARFDDRLTGPADRFAPGATIAHIDIHPGAIGKTVRTDIGIVGSCDAIVRAMADKIEAEPISTDASWWKMIDAWRARQSLSFVADDQIIAPQQAIKAAATAVRGARDLYVTTDVGQHQMWVAQHFPFDRPGRLITSGGFGTMGFGLPAAIGVQWAHPDALVLCVTGDGSFQMNSQEMATVRAHNLPVKLLLLNNGFLGMVRQLQEQSYDARYAETPIEVQPDFVALAKAYGWRGFRCAAPKALPRVMRQFLQAKGPALLDCRVRGDENCLPMIRPGGCHGDMILPGPAPV